MTDHAETPPEPRVAGSLLSRILFTNDGAGGLIAIAVGLVSLAEGLRLGLGTLSKMGAGYVPMAIGVAMIGLGLLLVVKVARKGAVLAHIPLGLPVILVLLALAAFGVLLPLFGLVPATIVLMLISSLAVTRRIGVADVVFAVVTSGLAVLVFINGLGVVLPILRWPF